MDPLKFINSLDILEHFSEGFLLLDGEGKIIIWNKALEEITGMKREEVLGRYHYDVMFEFVIPERRTPEMVEYLKSLLHEVLKTGKGNIIDKEYEVRMATKKGEVKTLLQSAFLFKTDSGFNLGAVLRDITDRKQIEEELRQKENRYRLIYESAHDSIFLLEKDVFIDCNPKTLETFGCSREDIVGKSPYLFSPEFQPDGRPSKEKALDKIGLALSGKSLTFDWVHQKLDGSCFDAEVSLNTVLLDGRTLLQAMVRNVSKRNKANSQLRKFSQCLLNFSFDSEKNIQSLTEVFGEIIGADAALYNRLEGETLNSIGRWGVPADYLPKDKADGHLCYDLILKQARDIFLVRDLPATPYFTSDPNVQKYSLRTYMGHPVKFGDKIIGSLCAVFTHDFNPDEADKLILSMVASAVGMEEERLNEFKKLQDSEKQYQSLSHLFQMMADHMPDLLWAKDLEKKYMFSNKAHRDNILNAANAGEVLGKTDAFFGQREKQSHPENPKWFTFGDQCADSDDIIMSSQKAEKFEESGFAKGKYMIYDVFKAPIFDDQGKMVGTVGTARDVTREKDVEQKIRKYTEELQELNSSKDKFFSIISHDLKGPFNAILGFSEILTREWDDFTEEERQHFVRNIHSSAQNTFKLLENLLAWSMAQTGKQNFSPFPVDLSVVTNDLVIFLREQAEKKQIRMFTAVNFGTVVLADEQMVRTVIRNLISNAIKFTPVGGQIKIYTEPYKDNTENHEMVKLVVTDTGVGIPDEMMGKLFRIDQQVRSTGTANEKGTGLGLILCKELIDKHGGRIWAESEEGKGSRFCITLPKV